MSRFVSRRNFLTGLGVGGAFLPLLGSELARAFPRRTLDGVSIVSAFQVGDHDDDARLRMPRARRGIAGFVRRCWRPAQRQCREEQYCRSAPRHRSHGARDGNAGASREAIQRSLQRPAGERRNHLTRGSGTRPPKAGFRFRAPIPLLTANLC